MKRYGFILMLLVSMQCSNHDEGDVKFLFYDAGGKMADEIGIDDIEQVDWDKQCYFFSQNKILDIKKLDLNNGKIDLIFRDQLLASSSGINIYSNELPTGFMFLCHEKGEIYIDDGSFCLKKIRGTNDEILNNSRYREFLRKANLLKR